MIHYYEFHNMDNFINYFSSSFICITLVGDMNLRAQGPSGPWRCPQCMLKCRVRPTRSHCPVGAVLVVLKRVSLDLHMKMKSSVLSVLTIVMCAFFSTEFSVATETKENVTGKFCLAVFIYILFFVVCGLTATCVQGFN